MSTDTIKCPGCGKEVPQDAENCPNCGAPISVLMHNDISGAPIDNSAAIDAMLRSASQFMEESESLGLNELDIFNDENEEEKQEETVFKKVTLKELPPELADNANNPSNGAVQVPNYTPSPAKPNNVPAADLPDFSAARNSNGKSGDNFVELQPQAYSKQAAQASSPAAPQAPNVQSGQTGYTPPSAPNIDTSEEEGGKAKRKKKNKPEKPKKAKKGKTAEPTLYEVDENGNPVKQKGKKTKAPKKDKNDKSVEKTSKKKASKGASAAVAVMAAVLALAIGGVGGFFAKTYLLPELPVPECQEFASKSVDAVNKNITGNRSIYIAEAYVNDGTYSAQCVFRALVENNDSGDISSHWFRVKVDHNDESTINIFFELNEEEYERLRNSESSDDRANAAVLRSYQNELERCIAEITGGTNDWSAANTALLNNTIHPYKADTASGSSAG